MFETKGLFEVAVSHHDETREPSAHELFQRGARQSLGVLIVQIAGNKFETCHGVTFRRDLAFACNVPIHRITCTSSPVEPSLPVPSQGSQLRHADRKVDLRLPIELSPEPGRISSDVADVA